MASKAGQVLSEAEFREYVDQHNAGVPLDPKFDNVVVESTLPSGPVYRYQTDEEAKASRVAADTAVKTADEEATRLEKVRADAVKRGAAVPPPPLAPAEAAPALRP